MKPVDIVIVCVVALVLAAVVFFLVREKKKGKTCVGCPQGATCGGNCCSCEKSSDC